MNFRRGLVTEIYPDKGTCRVKWIDDGIVSPEMQIIFSSTQYNKFYVPFGINELVVAIMSDHDEDGVVIGAVYNDEDKPSDSVSDHIMQVTFKDGATFSYDWQSRKLIVDIDNGDVELTANGSVTIQANGGVSITGDVDIDGDLTTSGKVAADGEISSQSDVKALTISLKTHLHSGVQTGPGTSGTPVP